MGEGHWVPREHLPEVLVRLLETLTDLAGRRTFQMHTNFSQRSGITAHEP